MMEAFVCGALILVVALLLALSHLPTQAAGNLQCVVDCIDRSGGMTGVSWFGYSASETREPTFSWHRRRRGHLHHRRPTRTTGPPTPSPPNETEILFGIQPPSATASNMKKRRGGSNTKGARNLVSRAPDDQTAAFPLSQRCRTGAYLWENSLTRGRWSSVATTQSQTEATGSFSPAGVGAG